MRTDGTDVIAWKADTVPPDVVQVMCFVYSWRKNFGVGPSWAEIAEFMGWPADRSTWRPKMKRIRRWGLRWTINVAGSTDISAAARPYVKAKWATLLVSSE